jgi:hypothetical protein
MFEICTSGYYVCMHIINTCAFWQRCESESFSTKWSGSRGRHKEICSCQGSLSQRLLPEIFWKNHTFEGLVLCCLRISSLDQWNRPKRRKKKKGRTWAGELWWWDGQEDEYCGPQGKQGFTWSSSQCPRGKPGGGDGGRQREDGGKVLVPYEWIN